MNNRLLAIAALAAIATASGAGTAAAQATSTGNLRVQATVLSSCAVQDSTLDYGAVSPTQLPAQRPQTDIKVTCTAGLPYSVGINDGSNASGNQRRMLRSNGDGSTPADYLSYNLFKSLTGNARWGDAVASERVTGTGSGATQNIPVFGGLVAGETGTGNFVDNAVITLRY
jgi:spore coat protein U-like protein